MKDDNSLEVCIARTGSGNGNGKIEEQKNSLSSTADMNLVSQEGVEAVILEVEYIESEDLKDVEDLELARQNLLTALDSKDWIKACEALNDVRRFVIFHKEILLEMLESVIHLVVKSLKNPRSALSKTAIMTSSDIFNAYGDNMVEYLDPLLAQLLLKASQDKRFVCEAAIRALITMTTSVSPALLLTKLQPNLKHRNPRIRAKASMCFSKSVPRLGVEGINAYGMNTLIDVAATQLKDQLPESRESARSLLSELQLAYEKSSLPPISDQEQSESVSWETFCQSNLSPLNAQAVLRVTNANRDTPAKGSS